MINRISTTAIILLVIVASLAIGCKSEPYVAKVNDVAISEKDYQKQLDMAKGFLEGVDQNTDEGKSIWESVKTELLNQMIDAELIRQSATNQKVTVSKEEVDDQLKGFKDEVGSEDEYNRMLKSYAITEDDLKGFIKDEVLTEKIYANVTAPANTKAEQVHAKQILVSTQEAADTIAARLKAGAKFDDLAKELSEDTSTKSKGGDLGFVPKGVLEPEVDQVTFSLTVGATSDPIRSNWGYHIIQVVEKDPDRDLSASYLRKTKDELFSAWLEIMRKQAKIEKVEKKG